MAGTEKKMKRTEDKATGKTAVKEADKATGKTAAKTSEKTSGKTAVKLSEKTSGKIGGKMSDKTTEQAAEKIDFGADPNNYVNRELSWLEFNYRVLSEARDKTIPLFDRLKFLSITASNLDEFYMVRVASLKDMVHAKYTKKDIAGLTPQEQLDRISVKTHELVDMQ